LVEINGAPTNSSSTSTARCRNSSARSGSVSTSDTARKSKFDWTTEKTVTGGDVLGK